MIQAKNRFKSFIGKINTTMQRSSAMTQPEDMSPGKLRIKDYEDKKRKEEEIRQMIVPLVPEPISMEDQIIDEKTSHIRTDIQQKRSYINAFGIDGDLANGFKPRHTKSHMPINSKDFNWISHQNELNNMQHWKDFTTDYNGKSIRMHDPHLDEFNFASNEYYKPARTRVKKLDGSIERNSIVGDGSSGNVDYKNMSKNGSI